MFRHHPSTGAHVTYLGTRLGQNSTTEVTVVVGDLLDYYRLTSPSTGLVDAGSVDGSVASPSPLLRPCLSNTSIPLCVKGVTVRLVFDQLFVSALQFETGT